MGTAWAAQPTFPGATNPGPSSAHFAPVQGKMDCGDFQPYFGRNAGKTKKLQGGFYF